MLFATLAQTTTTVADAHATSRSNAALPLILVAMGILAGFALAAPRWARAINARRARKAH